MRKRGASLIWALLVSLALLFITVTTANFVIKESQMSIRMDDSSRAYAAAESGIEWGKYCLAKISPCSGSYGPFHIGASTYSVTITGAPNTKIESIGTSNGVNRKLEFKVNTNASLTPVVDPANTTFSISGSYIQQFDYWTADGSSFAKVGVTSADSTQAIYMEHNATTKQLALVSDKGGVKSSSNPVSLAGIPSLSEPYILRIRIEYYKDLSAKMIVSRRDDTSSTGYTCVSTAVLDMRGGVRGSDMKKFYYSGNPNIATDPAYGDNSYYLIAIGSNVSYFDNMSTLGMAFSSNPAYATVPVYRFFKSTPDRIWTTSEAEKTKLTSQDGYTYEGIGYYELAAQVPGSVPVYRLFKPTLPNDRIITTSESEKNGLISAGFVYEGVAFYTFTTQVPGSLPVYRYYNSPGNRIWTTSVTEKASLDSAGWSYEGITFYAFPN